MPTVLAADPIPPMGAHQLLVLLLECATLLGLAVVLGRLAVLLRMPPVVGELTAGVLVGPSVLGHLAPRLHGWLVPNDPAQLHLLDTVGLLGVLPLVAITGMYIDLNLVRRQGATAVWVSAGGLLVPLGAGIGLGFLLPAPIASDPRLTFALFLGVAMGVSAIPVIAKILLEMRLLHRTLGQLVMSAAAVDDIVGWLALSAGSALAINGLHTGPVVVSVAGLIGVVLAAVFLGRPLARTAVRLASRSSDPAVPVATVVVLLLLCASGTHALGLEPVFGAFVCGLMVSATGLVNADWLAPLRTVVMAVLAPIFFATAGLRMDLTALGRPSVLVAAAVALFVAVASKMAGAYVGARASRLAHWEALALAAGLNARGVIGLVVAMVGLRLGILGTEAYTIIVLIAVVTSLMTPPILRYAARRVEVSEEEQERERVFAGAALPS